MISVKLKLDVLLAHPFIKSFIAYSIFRAFYGAGILLITWLFLENTDSPLWVSGVFLILSMIISRAIFRHIKKLRNTEDI